MTCRLSGLAVTLFVLVGLAACGSPDRTAPADAKVIESRLLAPCCWTQTLDVHDSPVSSALRDEIEARASAGESARKIEDDLAARYGERIRVVPPDRDPRGQLASGVVVAMGAALIALALRLRKWVARGALSPAASPPTVSDEYDRKLDDELAQLDRD